ncbi:MarR family winged helix-turn-helix transcriptional regulator [Paenibacillus faecalis]|uniref:MarR family winged helix-turn-helix transcriptional regulator n=1 Tax=Paenibacillus faecalis TaxID=2079532 RepID=UPI00131A5D8C|nr:MarR family transcriptional regulator [Paenibacillus faecalis]
MKLAGFLIMKIAKDLRYELAKELESLDLTPAQWAILKNIDMKEEMNSSLNDRTSKSIAHELQFDKPTVSGIINRLEIKNMVYKQPHPQDKRSFILSLTKEAKQRIPLLEEASERVMIRSLSNLSPEEYTQFIGYLQKVESTLHHANI